MVITSDNTSGRDNALMIRDTYEIVMRELWFFGIFSCSNLVIPEIKKLLQDLDDYYFFLYIDGYGRSERTSIVLIH